MRGLLPFGKKKNDEQAQQKQAHEYEEMVEKLLPWEFEQKVAVFLNPIKVPFVIAVGILGFFVEMKLPHQSKGAWSRSITEKGPQCMVHIAQLDEFKYRNSLLGSAEQKLNSFLEKPIKSINKTVLKNSHCFYEDNETRCEFINNSWVNLTFEQDMCGVSWDPEKHRCIKPDQNIQGMTWYERGHEPGLEKHLPLLPYSLLWMVFKLVFLPVHVVDRLANLAEGSPKPMNEPMFKLLTEPYCAPTGLGKLCGLLRPFAIISRVIRFSLLPNSLILPLVTMRHVKKCPDYLIYTQDVKFGFVVYCWLIFDLVSICGLYVLGKTVCGGKAISRMWYRAYKVLAIPLTLVSLILFFMDVFAVFQWRFWEGLSVVLAIMFTLNLGVDFSLDFARILANAVIIVDFLQLALMILCFVAPKMMQKVPLPEWLHEWVQRPSDVDNHVEASPTTVEMTSQEREGLLQAPRAASGSTSASGLLEAPQADSGGSGGAASSSGPAPAAADAGGASPAAASSNGNKAKGPASMLKGVAGGATGMVKGLFKK